MRLNILSDLHLRQGAFTPPRTDADAVILAGDVARPEQAIAWARAFRQPVIYVLGNHEFYGSSLPTALAELQNLAGGTGIRVLDRQALVLDGVRFLGATLWTDFMLAGEGAARERAIAEATRLVRDFSVIDSTENPGTKFTPPESIRVFRQHAKWLRQELAEPFDGPTVVITHHAPSPRSVHPRFTGSPLNGAFVSDLEALMGGDRVVLWVHGHTHDSFDYTVRGTRVVCNPRGYARDGVNENAFFDPRLVVDVGR
ncbi:metallophosphoesterase [Dyella sp.]|uniref:metallophosphoesterase n=1 Tax=Dyella sp. TaxID=1869338 RepID=UPI002B468C92|nr:metallophosphoesterase [Dyella sp.]HKT28509.1 metallophosphoesterase [Dyella sp.]